MMAEMPSESKLKSNEPQYDQDTGLPNTQDQEQQAKKSLRELAQDAKEFTQLYELPAWKKVEEFLDNQTKGMKEQLVVQKDFEEIKRIQTQIQTLKLLPNLIQSIIEDGKAAEEILSVFDPQTDRA